MLCIDYTEASRTLFFTNACGALRVAGHPAAQTKVPPCDAHETRNYFYAGAVLEREVSERLTLGAELFGNSPTEHAE